MDRPCLRVPRSPLPAWRGELAGFPWSAATTLSLVLADGSGAPEHPTEVRVAQDEEALLVRFDCADRDAWGTHRRRDAPLYEEEVVEIFLAPGRADPVRYFELEVSPLGALFDARIANSTGRRADLVADRAWDCPGLRWQVGRGAARQDWWAALAIPWSAVAPRPDRPRPRWWRANFYRIERPRGGAAEFSAWAPTLRRPADFHRPEKLGALDLGASTAAGPGPSR
jgi:hypothetical protein